MVTSSSGSALRAKRLQRLGGGLEPVEPAPGGRPWGERRAARRGRRAEARRACPAGRRRAQIPQAFRAAASQRDDRCAAPSTTVVVDDARDVGPRTRRRESAVRRLHDDLAVHAPLGREPRRRASRWKSAIVFHQFLAGAEHDCMAVIFAGPARPPHADRRLQVSRSASHATSASRWRAAPSSPSTAGRAAGSRPATSRRPGRRTPRRPRGQRPSCRRRGPPPRVYTNSKIRFEQDSAKALPRLVVPCRRSAARAAAVGAELGRDLVHRAVELDEQ